MIPPPQTPTAAAGISKNPSMSSKIPFRARKIRRLSSSSDTSIKIGKSPESPNAESSIAPKIRKSLSCKTEIDLALEHLRNSDPLLAALISAHRPPELTPCISPFQSLSRSILYQQLATKAAKSIYTRFISLCGEESSVLPETVLSLTPQKLREIGVSARKASYLHDLADKYATGILSDSSILEMDDDTLITMLTAVKGIGMWSVHMFMMFSLHRPDVLPVGDLGVRKGVQSLYGLKQLPKPQQMEEICEKWKPYRSVGSWYMWRLMEAKATGATRPSAATTRVEP
ncbi:hypothetical protein SLE2022_303480 [Rubroshorea leprosula]